MGSYRTIREATEAWMDSFSAVPRGICEKLLEADFEALREVTPPSRGDRVRIWYGRYEGMGGMVIARERDGVRGETLYTVRLDDNNEELVVSADDFEVARDDTLPMWGMLWAFSDSADNYWLEHMGGLQIMADCGFRIYEQEDYEYIFGIDGAGYDFYADHWMPLYKARGLQWHDTDVENRA